MKDQILILDFDHRFSAAIAAKLRAERISARILPGNTSAESIMAEEALGVILSGGTRNDLPQDFDGQLLRYGVPVLALGSAAPVVATLLGAQVMDAIAINDVDTLVFLPSKITNELTESDRLFATVRPLQLTDDLQAIATWQDKAVGISHKTLDIYALDCQLEPNDPDMMSLMTQFALDVCGATRWWGQDAFISIAKNEISQAAGDGKALCVMSGGLDSGVTALLAHRALGGKLTCVFVDTGFLRENDVVEFSAYYKNAGLNLQIVNAADRILDALRGLTSQEAKRKAMMEALNAVLEETASLLTYDLLVESRSSDHMFSGKINPLTHSQLARGKRTIAPLTDLFKDEIRMVGEALGMPHEMTIMQPFPWTGLALRIFGECTKEKLNLLRWADNLFQHTIREAGLAKRLWKYFAVLYEVPYKADTAAVALGLRAVSISHTGNDLRVIPARLPYDLLEQYTQKALDHSAMLDKVIYDLTPGVSPQETEWH
jgi:GMP synthase (glutamine-hydrolysing)